MKIKLLQDEINKKKVEEKVQKQLELNNGLFIKKSLWSCASCDKEIDKMDGKLGEYRNWYVH